jgi:uncharacterized protein (DUF433 family)
MHNPIGDAKFGDRIVRDAAICGEPVFKGTRVTRRTVLASLANGDSIQGILAAFPSLKPEDVQLLSPLLRLPLKRTCPFLLFRNVR